MTPEEFVNQTRQSILEENMQIYRELFATNDLAKVSDPYWLGALGLIQQLGDADQAVLFSIIRQTIVDTLSSVFAVLDGVACLPRYKEDFSLRYGTDTEPLNGELQDLFLAAEEEFEEGQPE